jgi:1-acyl-sn-glycerol-3-phosphate acyltransferase
MTSIDKTEVVIETPFAATRLNQRWLRAYITFNQIIIWFVFRLLSKIIGAKITSTVRSNDTKSAKNYIILSNHQSILDPFFITTQLPMRAWLRIAPIRFLAYNQLFDTWYKRWALISWGAYPAYASERLPYGLGFAETVLRAGGSVTIFPEGKRTAPGAIPARSGATVLANLPDTEVISAHIHWDRRGIVARTYRLHLAKPESMAGKTAQEMLDAIYALPLPEEK